MTLFLLLLLLLLAAGGSLRVRLSSLLSHRWRL